MKTSHAIAISLAFTGVAVAANVSVLIGNPIEHISSLVPVTSPSTTAVSIQPIDSAVAPAVIQVKNKRKSATTKQTTTTTQPQVSTVVTTPKTTTTEREREREREDDDD
jgi:hypothetical protein